MLRTLVCWLGVLAPACVSVPPMSAAKHDEAAAQNLDTARADRAHYVPDATESVVHCSLTTDGDVMGVKAEVPPPCWNGSVNPTTHFLAEARAHERIAKAHLAASKELREVEERACAGISERDRHTSPFAHPEDISSVSIDVSSGQSVGVTVAFAPVPGLTVGWLERVVNCHLAIDAEEGNDVPERAECPLVPRGVRAEVVGDGRASKVILRADSQKVVQEIITRVQHLQQEKSATPGGSATEH